MYKKNLRTALFSIDHTAGRFNGLERVSQWDNGSQIWLVLFYSFQEASPSHALFNYVLSSPSTPLLHSLFLLPFSLSPSGPLPHLGIRATRGSRDVLIKSGSVFMSSNILLASQYDLKIQIRQLLWTLSRSYIALVYHT